MSMSWVSSNASKIIVGAATLLSPEAKEEPVNRLLVDSIRAEARDHSKDQLALRIDPIDTARNTLKRESDELCKRAAEMSIRHAPEAEWGKFFEEVERWNRRLERFEEATKKDSGMEPIDPVVLRFASEAAQWLTDLIPRWIGTDAVRR